MASHIFKQLPLERRDVSQIAYFKKPPSLWGALSFQVIDRVL